MNIFEKTISEYNGNGLHGIDIQVVQVNIGLSCNQQCSHCHVSASPKRDETMSWETMERVIELANKVQPNYIDITGGEPELHPHLQRFIEQSVNSSIPVQLRSNLTLLDDEKIAFFTKNNVGIVGSMPCYLKENVDKQRGDGVFEKSISALQKLNKYGYGKKKA